jgi:ribosomal protein S14
MKLFSKKTDFLHRIQFKNKEHVLLLRKLVLRTTHISRFYKKSRLTQLALPGPRINNCCIITGRTRAVYKGFKASRFVLKGMGSVGYLPGVRLSS